MLFRALYTCLLYHPSGLLILLQLHRQQFEVSAPMTHHEGPLNPQSWVTGWATPLLSLGFHSFTAQPWGGNSTPETPSGVPLQMWMRFLCRTNSTWSIYPLRNGTQSIEVDCGGFPQLWWKGLILTIALLCQVDFIFVAQNDKTRVCQARNQKTQNHPYINQW